jgi:hypothetical protein
MASEEAVRSATSSTERSRTFVAASRSESRERGCSDEPNSCWSNSGSWNSSRADALYRSSCSSERPAAAAGSRTAQRMIAHALLRSRAARARRSFDEV